MLTPTATFCSRPGTPARSRKSTGTRARLYGVWAARATSSTLSTIVCQYPATPTTSLYSFYMGNVQRLTNGNTLINWAVGNLPKLTEVRPDGTKAFEMNWVSQFEAYRTW